MCQEILVKTYVVRWFLVPLQVTTAVLSITAKAKARAKKSEASEEKMEVVRFSSSLLITVEHNFPPSKKCWI